MKPYIGQMVHFFPPPVREDENPETTRERLFIDGTPLAAVVTALYDDASLVALHIHVPAKWSVVRKFGDGQEYVENGFDSCVPPSSYLTFHHDMASVPYDPYGVPGKRGSWRFISDAKIGEVTG